MANTAAEIYSHQIIQMYVMVQYLYHADENHHDYCLPLVYHLYNWNVKSFMKGTIKYVID